MNNYYDEQGILINTNRKKNKNIQQYIDRIIKLELEIIDLKKRLIILEELLNKPKRTYKKKRTN